MRWRRRRRLGQRVRIGGRASCKQHSMLYVVAVAARHLLSIMELHLDSKFDVQQTTARDAEVRVPLQTWPPARRAPAPLQRGCSALLRRQRRASAPTLPQTAIQRQRRACPSVQGCRHGLAPRRLARPCTPPERAPRVKASPFPAVHFPLLLTHQQATGNRISRRRQQRTAGGARGWSAWLATSAA